MISLKAVISILCYIFSFLSFGTSGYVDVRIDRIPDTQSYFIYCFENQTNKPVYNQPRIIKVEKQIGDGLVDVSSSVDTSVKENAYVIRPYESDENRCVILEPLEPANYKITVQYNTAEGIGNSVRKEKTVVSYLTIYDHNSNVFPE